MVSVNPLEREIQLKLVYYGPGLGGKTTTLQHIHATTAPGHRGKLVSLATPVDRTLYFDYLPVRLPAIGGYTLKLQLFTVPGQVHFNATRKLVLNHADGVAFVADSQRSRVDANLESMDNLKSNLQENQLDPERFPMVLQYNKRDLKDIFPLDELDGSLNPRRLPSLGTCALTGQGVYEGLEILTKEVLRDLKKRDVLARQETRGGGGQISFEEEAEGISDRIQAYSERLAKVRIPSGDNGNVGTFPPRRATPPTGAFPAPEGLPDLMRTLDRPTIPAPFALTEKVVVEKQCSSEPLKREEIADNSSLTFAPMWPVDRMTQAQEIEQALRWARYSQAIQLINSELDVLVASLREEAPRRSARTLFALLGLDGDQYQEIVAAAASPEGNLTVETALRAYLFLLEVFDRRR